MSKWRVGIDCGEWFLSEIADQWGGGEAFATEAEALEELRRVQLRGVLAAESDLKIVKARLIEARKRLAGPPRISRMRSASLAPSQSTSTEKSK